MPIFEGAGNVVPMIFEAVINCIPGSFNAYKAGDVVIVGFEEYAFEHPIVLGKLYQGIPKQSTGTESSAVQGSTGGLRVESLGVSNEATIPYATKLSLNTATTAETPSDGLKSFGTVQDMANAILILQAQVAELQSQISNLTAPLN